MFVIVEYCPSGNLMYICTKNKNKVTPRLSMANKYTSKDKAIELFNKFQLKDHWNITQVD